MTSNASRITGDSSSVSPPRVRSWHSLYLAAGAAALLFVVLLIAALVLDFLAPPPVHGGAATLEFIQARKSIYVAEQILWILPNILPVIVFVALCAVLWNVDRSLALLATLLGAIPWAVMLAVPVTSRGSLTLVYLSDRYRNAGSLDERHAYATAAEAIIAENNTPAVVGVLSALGIVLMSLVMLRGVFPRWIAWLGFATGGLGVAGEALRHAVPGFYGVYGVFLWAWFIALGIALIRLGLREQRWETPPGVALGH